MTSLKETFADAVKTPTGFRLESSHPDFLEVINGTFGFHDAEVLSSHLDLASGRLDLLLNYIVRWILNEKTRHYDLLWRKLSLAFDGIFYVEFGHYDQELGMPHYVRRSFDLEYLRRNNPRALPRLAKTYLSNLVSSELNAISIKIFGQESIRPRRFTVDFDWLTVPSLQTASYKSLRCTVAGLEFVSEPSDEREQPWIPWQPRPPKQL